MHNALEFGNLLCRILLTAGLQGSVLRDKVFCVGLPKNRKETLDLLLWANDHLVRLMYIEDGKQDLTHVNVFKSMVESYRRLPIVTFLLVKSGRLGSGSVVYELSLPEAQNAQTQAIKLLLSNTECLRIIDGNAGVLHYFCTMKCPSAFVLKRSYLIPRLALEMEVTPVNLSLDVFTTKALLQRDSRATLDFPSCTTAYSVAKLVAELLQEAGHEAIIAQDYSIRIQGFVPWENLQMVLIINGKVCRLYFRNFDCQDRGGTSYYCSAIIPKILAQRFEELGLPMVVYANPSSDSPKLLSEKGLYWLNFPDMDVPTELHVTTSNRALMAPLTCADDLADRLHDSRTALKPFVERTYLQQQRILEFNPNFVVPLKLDGETLSSVDAVKSRALEFDFTDPLNQLNIPYYRALGYSFKNGAASDGYCLSSQPFIGCTLHQRQHIIRQQPSCFPEDFSIKEINHRDKLVTLRKMCMQITGRVSDITNIVSKVSKRNSGCVD